MNERPQPQPHQVREEEGAQDALGRREEEEQARWVEHLGLQLGQERVAREQQRVPQRQRAPQQLLAQEGGVGQEEEEDVRRHRLPREHRPVADQQGQHHRGAGQRYGAGTERRGHRARGR